MLANSFLTFKGVGFSSGKAHSFDVMCGDNPPTITGGYAKWTSTPRPYQRSLTVPNGYDPMTMNVDVRFGRWDDLSGAWQVDDAHAQQVEKDIGWLEWMAGSNFATGPSPIVYVWSHSTSGGADTFLIPPNVQGTPWVVTGLQWGKAVRNQNGFRVWQEASITLQHYMNLKRPPAPDENSSGGYFVSKAGKDTPLLIAAADGVSAPLVYHRILAGRICEAPQNNPCKRTNIKLRGKSLSFKIRHGVSVYIPAHLNA